MLYSKMFSKHCNNPRRSICNWWLLVIGISAPTAGWLVIVFQVHLFRWSLNGLLGKPSVLLSPSRGSGLSFVVVHFHWLAIHFCFSFNRLTCTTLQYFFLFLINYIIMCKFACGLPLCSMAWASCVTTHIVKQSQTQGRLVSQCSCKQVIRNETAV